MDARPGTPPGTFASDSRNRAGRKCRAALWASAVAPDAGAGKWGFALASVMTLGPDRPGPGPVNTRRPRLDADPLVARSVKPPGQGRSRARRSYRPRRGPGQGRVAKRGAQNQGYERQPPAASHGQPCRGAWVNRATPSRIARPTVARNAMATRNSHRSRNNAFIGDPSRLGNEIDNLHAAGHLGAALARHLGHGVQKFGLDGVEGQADAVEAGV